MNRKCTFYFEIRIHVNLNLYKDKDKILKPQIENKILFSNLLVRLLLNTFAIAL